MDDEDGACGFDDDDGAAAAAVEKEVVGFEMNWLKGKLP